MKIVKHIDFPWHTWDIKCTATPFTKYRHKTSIWHTKTVEEVRKNSEFT